MGSVEKQIPRWELIYGLSLICGIIKQDEEDTLELLGNSKTWNNLNRKIKKDSGT